MTTLSRTILAASVTGLVAGGIIDYRGVHLDAAWAVVLPFGAIFYGMFLISFMMEKEVAKFDEDEAIAGYESKYDVMKLKAINRNAAS
jgi:hypothetical protein